MRVPGGIFSTDTLLPGFRPAPKPFFTAALLLVASGTRTRYTAIALHADAEGRKNREEMSFCEGWNTAIDRMVHFVKRQQAGPKLRGGPAGDAFRRQGH